MPHPCCSFQGRLRRHGFYTRNALTLLATYLIVIQRYYCPSCKKTVSLLPSFLAPRFQYSLSCIFFALFQFSVRRIQLHRIAEVINDRAHRQELSHQQVSFYRKRIYDNQPLITAFLGQQGLFLADLDPSSWLEAWSMHVFRQLERYSISLISHSKPATLWPNNLFPVLFVCPPFTAPADATCSRVKIVTLFSVFEPVKLGSSGVLLAFC